MNNSVKKIISVVLCALLTAVFIVIMHFCAPQIAEVPETTGEITYSVATTDEDGRYTSTDYTVQIGKDITAIRISDLGECNRITKVNYVADEFVMPNSFSGDIQVVDLTKPFKFAEKGTLIFVVLNLDPESKDFLKQAERLSEFKIGDNWNFTLSLPKIFNASNVYCNGNLEARHGDIENYDFIKYCTSYDKKTDEYSQEVERTTLNLQFYTRRQALNKQIVTVHYQSSGSVYSAMADSPLIGEESAVSITIVESQNLLIAFAVIAAVVLTVLVVLSILKRTRSFINAIIWLLGIFLMLFPKFLLGQTTIAPLFWLALSWTAAFITLGGALMAMSKNFRKTPLKFVLPALMAVGGVIAFIYPFVPFGAAKVLHVIFTVIKAIGSLALLALTGVAAFGEDDTHYVLEAASATVIAVATFASVFAPAIFPVYIYPMFWLCVLTVFATFVGVFMVFYDTEKANAYLTANLHLEVERQLKDIKAVITERDDLLRFVSHDMKKPLQSSAPLIDTLIDREKDAEQTKALIIVKQNNSRVINNLSEIGTYARFNYIAEPSQITDLYALCAAIYEFHDPDCNANGIILNNLVNKRFKVFAKKQGLENAISNIVLNAIEHANCANITLSAHTSKNKVILKIEDDGQGIKAGTDVFSAYGPEKSTSSGVGLYICKNIIEAMNGELSYESKPGCTVFSISLLKAK